MYTQSANSGHGASPEPTSVTSVTLVTAIFELGRSRLQAPFHRLADHYTRHLPTVLSIDLPMVIYCDAAHRPLVQSLRGDLPTHIITLDPEKLVQHELYQPVQHIRSNPDWLGQSDWLAHSPQACLAGYNPVVLTKPLWLFEQAQRNPFASTHVYWIDAGLGHTVPAELLQATIFRRLAARHQRFLLLAYPYDPVREVHGFDAEALARLSGVERTRWVSRGGFFGGTTDCIREVGARYSQRLEQTLAAGLMGTEESLLTIASYADPQLHDLQFIGHDGLIWPFLAEIANGWRANPRVVHAQLETLCETWFVSYNTPLQFERLLDSIAAAEPRLLATGKLALINNSTDTATFAHYDAICHRHGIVQHRDGNRGINGARIYAAERFQQGGRHAMFWFEDDMLLWAESSAGQSCPNGFPRYVHGLAAASLAILQRECADYVKLSFSEFFGAHHTQWAWHNLDAEARAHYFPGVTEPPRARYSSIDAIGPVSYAVGEAYYSNWPQIVSRRGTARLFFEERREPCLEQYWMARSFELLRLGHVKAAVFLASPVNHHRTQDYARAERIEYQRVVPRHMPQPVSPEPDEPPRGKARTWPLESDTIFVSIANYRDSETPHTVRNLFANAARPERIHVGVFSQVVPGVDDDCLPHPPPLGQLRELRVDASESLGACWARARILDELLQGEEYVLQIDSHSRFEPGWDETLLAMLRRCPSDQALLTTYPPAYVPPAPRGHAGVTLLAADAFNDMGILMVKPRTLYPVEVGDAPIPSAFLSANCLFGPAQAFRAVPYDPRLYFHGEEISLAVRFWTHGWDLYAPDRCFMYHDYSIDRGRPRHWSDQGDWVKLNMRSFARLRHLFGMETSHDLVVLRDLDHYGLGAVRTLAEYEEFADVCFATKQINSRAADARFPPHPSSEQISALRAARHRFIDPQADENTFTPIRQTRSGAQASIEATARLRPALARWLHENGIRRLVDAGCGDFNWLRLVNLDGLDIYVGYDIVPEIIVRNQQLYGQRRGLLFTLGNVTDTPLVACDAILCRNVLEFLTPPEQEKALANFRRSGARWLLLSIPAETTSVSPPAGLPLDAPPELRWPDGVGQQIGLWRL